MANNLLLLKIYQLLIRIKLLTSCPCWWYKQLLSKSTLVSTLEVRTIAFSRHPYAGGADGCFLNHPPMLEVQTVAFYINSLICRRYEQYQLLS